MKSTYYYLDESGTIDGDSKYFILGCYKTDNPEDLRAKMVGLQNSILVDPIFGYERKKFQLQGFHATENHPDIRSRVYSLISRLNIRAYVLLLDKNSDFSKRLISNNSNDEIYMICLEKLLSDRLLKNRTHKNILVFENYGNKPNVWKKNIEGAINNILEKLEGRGFNGIKYEIEVRDKTEILLSVIDYINYLYGQLFNKKPSQRNIENFKIIEPKIALTYKMAIDEYLDKNIRLKIE